MLDEIITELRESIEKAIEALRRELSRVRTGRAHPSMLDPIKVDYYGTPTPIGQMATVSVPEPRLLVVKPWEKGQAKHIDKAIREGNLGLNPQVDGEVIRIPIPALTEERRKEMVKLAKKHGEEGKVAIRKHRRDANEMIDQLKGDGDVSEDDADRSKKKVEDVVAAAVKQVDEVIAHKEKEILEV